MSLLKTGVGIHDDEPIASLGYDDWQESAGLHWPQRLLYLKGFAETVGDELATRSVKPAEITAETFRMPEP